MGISFVIPVYKNRSTLEELHHRLVAVMQSSGNSYEIIFVNDACPEGSAAILEELHAADERVKVLTHETNRGQHAAILTGLSAVTHDIVVTMDADLQDDPRFVPNLVEPLASADVVFAAKAGNYESPLRLLTARLFKLSLSMITMGRLPLRSSLFMALQRNTCSKLLSFAAMEPHLLALIGVLGFRSTTVDYIRPPRSGASSYTTAARVKTALHAFRTVRRFRAFALHPQISASLLPVFSDL